MLCRSLFIWCSLTWFFLSLSVYWCHIQKLNANTDVKDFFPMFSSRSFTVSGFIFKSLYIRNKLLWECNIGVQFHSFAYEIQFSQHHLLNSLSFPYWVCLAPLSNISWPYVYGFISGLSILFHWSMCLFLCLYRTVW